MGPVILFPNREVEPREEVFVPPNKILEGLGFEKRVLLPKIEVTVGLVKMLPLPDVFMSNSEFEARVVLGGTFAALSTGTGWLLGAAGFENKLLNSPTPCDWLKRLSLKGFLNNSHPYYGTLISFAGSFTSLLSVMPLIFKSTLPVP